MTTETKVTHTPGPWALETVKTSVGVCHKIGRFPTKAGARKETYGCVYEDGTSNWRSLENCTLDSELLANARLMAAAPDLLAALKELREVCAAGMRVLALKTTPAHVMTEWFSEVQSLGIPNGFGVRAQNAIAKAEGRS